jgi:hypothetical protein
MFEAYKMYAWSCTEKEMLLIKNFKTSKGLRRIRKTMAMGLVNGQMRVFAD